LNTDAEKFGQFPAHSEGVGYGVLLFRMENDATWASTPGIPLAHRSFSFDSFSFDHR
jgi:hypothetical protein